MPMFCVFRSGARISLRMHLRGCGCGLRTRTYLRSRGAWGRHVVSRSHLSSYEAFLDVIQEMYWYLVGKSR